ncbi:MAG: hypothetical protein NT154_18340 [Verrucomicrobia bacterium]|nr:hypothetical protein [Verrucomicrobiota bacterium]
MALLAARAVVGYNHNIISIITLPATATIAGRPCLTTHLSAAAGRPATGKALAD